ncbi:MAG: PH domain-containing protein [Verrucomicrobiota bacterium]
MSNSSKETTILEASLNPKVRSYWMFASTMVFCVSIIGIPLLIIWIPLGLYLTGRHLKSIRCVLTNKSLKVSKGIFVKTEKTIPLEKITDLGMVQGPLMRHFGIEQLTVETAGQSGMGALVQVQGIIDARAFRQNVLDQKDQLSAHSSPTQAESASTAITPDSQTLQEIRDTLQRIEKLLATK